MECEAHDCEVNQKRSIAVITKKREKQGKRKVGKNAGWSQGRLESISVLRNAL